MDWIATLETHWFWLTLGLVLGAAEIVAPGFFLMWLGMAAFVTGIIAWALPISMPAEVIIFAALAIATVYGARRWMVQNPIISSDPLLNDRGGRMVGEVVTVIEAIAEGQGRVKVGDSVWSAKGPETPVGSKVRITGAQGSVLTVEGV
jgi:inner membrane protein